MRLLCLQHVAFEGLAAIGDWSDRRQLEIVMHRADSPIESWPDLDEFEGYVILGGPMGVHDVDRCPWLLHEKAVIAEIIQSQKPVLGLCLGAQLLAESLGASISQNPVKEIGWFPVTATTAAQRRDWPAEFPAFHWHGETFGLPKGAMLLGASEACATQGFIAGPVMGWQFHLEMTVEAAKNLYQHCALEVEEAIQDPRHQTTVVAAEQSLAETENFQSAQELLFHQLDQHFSVPGN